MPVTTTPDGASLNEAASARPAIVWRQVAAIAPAAVALTVSAVAVLRFGLAFDPHANGDPFWLLIDLSMAIALAGWGALRVSTDRRDGIGYLLQCSALAWSLACVGDTGAVRPDAWAPFGAFGADAQVVAHLVARSLLIAAVVVVLPDRFADRFMRRGPLDAAVAGATVVSLIVFFVEPVSRELRLTPFGFGNRAWIEVGRQVPTTLLVVLLVAHVAAAAALAWTRRGLPPTSFQVIGWVLSVATLPLAVGAVGARLDDNVLDILTLFVFPALPVLSVISIVRAGVAGARTVGDLRLAQHRMVEAVEDERRRLRREMHDGLGPALAGIALGVRAAGAQVESLRPDAAALLGRLGDEVDTCLDEVRRIINDLRPPVLDQLGLAGAIEAHARRMCSSSGAPELTLSLDGLGTEPLSAAVELAAFRITSEAMTNVMRHAGATRCRVAVAIEREAIVVEIEDDGRGLPVDLHTGVGLVSMRERASAVGGDVSVGAGAGGGTLVRARLRRGP